MSIQQSVNNMLATAAVVGGVAKHGVEEEARNKLAAIDEYFGSKEKLLNLQAENESNILNEKDNKSAERKVNKQIKETTQGIAAAEEDEKNYSGELADLMTTPAPRTEDEMFEQANNRNDIESYIKNAQTRQKEGAESLQNLNKRLEEIKAANKNLQELMRANEASRIGVQEHMNAIKSGKYKKLINKLESEGGKK